MSKTLDLKNNYMKTNTIKLYKYKELSKKRQAEVIENYRQWNVDDNEWDLFIIDDFEQELKKLGYNDAKVLYSGFSSQGDGACFTASMDLDDLKVIAKRHKIPVKPITLGDMTGGIKHNWRHFFSTSTDVYVEPNAEYNHKTDEEYTAEEQKAIDETAEALEKAILKEREVKGNEIYKYLEKVYEDLLSDEQVAQSLIANDYYFNDQNKIDN